MQREALFLRRPLLPLPGLVAWLVGEEGPYLLGATTIPYQRHHQ